MSGGERQSLLPDVEGFLAGCLTSPRAVRVPLVALGEPGSGTSKLAEVLAARLPEHDFLTVLVELRDVAAESLVLERVEQAIVRGPASGSPGMIFSTRRTAGFPCCCWTG